MALIATLRNDGSRMTFRRAVVARIKRIRGVAWLYHSFVSKRGSWIFARRKLEWLMEGDSYRALPPPLRVFARYCRYAPETRRGSLLGAQSVYLLASRLTRMARFADSARIGAGPYVVYLNTSDPRSLVVPGEILNLSKAGLLKDLLTEGDTFVDIGANHGSFAIVAGALVGSTGRIVALEPQPRLAQLLARSLSENCTCPFTVLPIACSDVQGEQTLFIPRRTSGSAGLYRKFSGTSATHRVKVSVRRFDDAVDWRSFTGNVVMKVDIEGAELGFLRGATRALQHLRPAIIMEINSAAAHAAGHSVGELVQQLEILGYDASGALRDPTSSPPTLEHGRPRNVILLPRNFLRDSRQPRLAGPAPCA
jgi:FkbM family methyltransferase